MMSSISVVLVLNGNTGSSLAVTRALGAAGWDVLVDGTDTNSSRSRWSTDAIDLPDPYSDPRSYAEELTLACARHGVDLVAPSNDHELDLAWTAVRAADGTRVLGGDETSSRRFLDKWETIEFARRHGYPVPESVAPATLEDVAEACARIGFPCVVKPRRSHLRVGGRLRALRHAVVSDAVSAVTAAAARRSDEGEMPIVQRLVPGRSISVTVVVAGGTTVARVVRETRSFLPVEGGISVFKRTIPAETAGVEAATSLLVDAGLQGLAEIEFQLDGEGDPYLMEVGPRPHGWLQLAEAACPGLIGRAAAAVQGVSLDPLPPYRSGVEMRWVGGELRRLRHALASRKAEHGMSRRAILAPAWPPWRPGMLYDNVTLADPAPWAPGPIARLIARSAERTRLDDRA